MNKEIIEEAVINHKINSMTAEELEAVTQTKEYKEVEKYLQA